MKIKKSIHEIPDILDMNQLDLAKLQLFKIFSLPIWLVIITISLGFVSKSVRAGTEDIQLYYRYVPYEGPASTTGTSGQRPKQSSGASSSMSGDQRTPVKKPERDTGEFPSGEFPSFVRVDINGDHYVTKDELKNFPDLLQVFDKVDAGKDGRLEQLEYQNLEMETKREGEIL
jgi:hypothetical protein